MQKVSKEYKASMKDSLRERAYIMISFGVVNQEAQAKAKVDSGEFAYFSNPDNLFNEGTDDVVYATLEENFTRVDCSMYLSLIHIALLSLVQVSSTQTITRKQARTVSPVAATVINWDGLKRDGDTLVTQVLMVKLLPLENTQVKFIPTVTLQT